MPSFVQLIARIEHSFCNENVRHVDGVRDRSQKNQRSQSKDRARRSCFKREDEHDECENIRGCDRQESRASRTYEYDNESECAPLNNTSGEPFPELAIPISIDVPGNRPGGKSVYAPNNPPVVIGAHVALAQGRDQYRTSNHCEERTDPCMLAKSE